MRYTSSLAIKLIQTAIPTANADIVIILFLLFIGLGSIFSASKVGCKETEIGMLICIVLLPQSG